MYACMHVAKKPDIIVRRGQDLHFHITGKLLEIILIYKIRVAVGGNNAG